MKCKNANYCSGFTLFELMVVLSLMSVVSTIGITGFFRMTDYWNDLHANMRLHKDISRSFTSLADDFENMLSATACGSYLQGKRADIEDNEQFWRLSFEDDRITMPVDVYNPLSGQRKRLSVSYYIERNSDFSRLIRTATPLGGPEQEGSKVIVADNITGIRIHYFDGDKWQGQWEFPDTPVIVEISLSAMDGVRTDRNLARTMSFLIQVQ